MRTYGTLGLRDSEYDRPVRESSLPFMTRLERANYQTWRSGQLARLGVGERFAPVISERTRGRCLRKSSPVRPS